jgi:hypothetical protein
MAGDQDEIRFGVARVNDEIVIVPSQNHVENIPFVCCSRFKTPLKT